MVHLTLAISDFMLMLLSAALWTAAGFAGWALAGVAVIGSAALIAWRFRR